MAVYGPVRHQKNIIWTSEDMGSSHSINFPALLLQKAVIDLFNIRLSALVDLYFSFYEIFV
jgi:hypothetical protein